MELNIHCIKLKKYGEYFIFRKNICILGVYTCLNRTREPQSSDNIAQTTLHSCLCQRADLACC